MTKEKKDEISQQELERRQRAEERGNLTQKIKYLEEQLAVNKKKLEEMTDLTRDLSEANREMSKANQGLSDANREMAQANQDLSDANQDLAKSNEKLADANFKLTHQESTKNRTKN
jgi:methyl-accepting chemotaxis protein